MPRLSIILPAYNAEKTLEASVRSVLSQSFSDFELILIDDGSTDGTPALCARYAADDFRVRALRQENQGVSAARNAGLRAAEGECIAFLDADDFLEPDTYRSMFAVLDKYGTDSAVCGYYDEMAGGIRTENPPPLAKGAHGSEEIMNVLVLPILGDRLRKNPVLGTACCYLFSAEEIRNRKLSFSGAYLEDELFVVEYFARPLRLASTGTALYHYVQNPRSVTRRYMRDCAEVFKASLQRKHELIARYGIPVLKDWADNAAWAGLLICAANEFAPGNDWGLREKLNEVKHLCADPVFARALKYYTPRDMPRKKAVVAALLRRRMFFTLALLYTWKNRGR